jgi:vancomycin resistance protein YoaR
MDEAREAVHFTRSHSTSSNGSAVGWTAPLLAGLGLSIAIMLALAGLVVAFERTHADVVYPGVTVGGMHLGGMTKERALAELRPVYESRMEVPLMVSAADLARQERLEGLGVTLSVQPAVDAAFSVGRSGRWQDQLVTQIDAFLHGYNVDSPAMRIDRAKLRDYVTSLTSEVDRPVRDARLEIGGDLSLQVTTSVVGRKVDVEAGVQAMYAAILAGSSSVTLPVLETEPKRSDADIDAAARELSALLSGPVGLEFQGQQWTLSAKQIFDLTTIQEQEGTTRLTVSLETAPLKKMVADIAEGIDQRKIDARYDWNGGDLKMLRPGQDGRKVDRERALSGLVSAMMGEQRIVALPVEVERAAGGSLDPTQLGIKEQIELGRTVLTGVPEKIHNVKLAASRLNGVLLAPGATFSFNEELGPTTLKSGYQTGFAISVNNGEMQTIPSVAGGICQVATTLLHAVFWAGYQIEERFPHLYWIPNYGNPPRGMVGLDATVDDPFLDFKFTNNTENYLLIHSKVEGSNLEFILYGQKPDWKVEVQGPIITDVVKADPKMITEIESSWPESRRVQVEGAQDGMKVRIIRRVTSGSDVRTLELKSDYRPSRNVTLVGGIKPEATPGATPGPGTPGPTPGPGTPVPAPAQGTPPASTPMPGGPTPTPGGPTPSPAPPAEPTPTASTLSTEGTPAAPEATAPEPPAGATEPPPSAPQS